MLVGGTGRAGEVYLGELDEAGALVARSAWPTKNGLNWAVAGGSDTIVFGGAFGTEGGDTLDLGDGVHTSRGNADLFVARLAPLSSD